MGLYVSQNHYYLNYFLFLKVEYIIPDLSKNSVLSVFRTFLLWSKSSKTPVKFTCLTCLVFSPDRFLFRIKPASGGNRTLTLTTQTSSTYERYLNISQSYGYNTVEPGCKRKFSGPFMLNLDIKETGYSGNLDIWEKKGWSSGFSYIQVQLYLYKGGIFTCVSILKCLLQISFPNYYYT
jgi:hypothetical protein